MQAASLYDSMPNWNDPYIETLVEDRLNVLDMMRPNTTPADGNCLVHAVLYLMRYAILNIFFNICRKALNVCFFRNDEDENIRNMSNMDHRKFRQKVVNSIDKSNLHWDFETRGFKSTWKDEMRRNGTFCDEIFIQLVCNMLKRRINLFPVFGIGQDHTPMSPQFDNDEESNPPHYNILYYSETRFRAGHYQTLLKKQ